MTVDVPPSEDEEEREKTLDELLWDLLVGEEDVRVDPATGDIEPAGEKSS